MKKCVLASITYVTCSLALLAVSGCQNLKTNQVKSNQMTLTERVPYVQPAIFLGKAPTVDDLQHYHWQLYSVNNNVNSYRNSSNPPPLQSLQPQIDKGKVTLDFSPNQLHYSVGCNQITSRYRMQKDTLEVNTNGQSTQMACGNMQPSEDWLAKQMSNNSQLSIMVMDWETQAMMIQTKPDGSSLTWDGVLKPEVKYGQGQTMFLEVKPKWQFCDNLTDKKCMEVREITYDGQGLKTAAGKWHLLDAPIIGYRHDERAQRVLRIKRYRTPPKDTMGYGSVYALDSIVETNELPK